MLYMNHLKEQEKLDLDLVDRLELTTRQDLAETEQRHDGNQQQYVTLTVEELRILMNEIKRLRKEVRYLIEALRVEEQQTTRFRKEHDCY